MAFGKTYFVFDNLRWQSALLEQERHKLRDNEMAARVYRPRPSQPRLRLANSKNPMLDDSILSFCFLPPSGISLSLRERCARVLLACCRRFPTLAAPVRCSLLSDRRFNMPVPLQSTPSIRGTSCECSFKQTANRKENEIYCKREKRTSGVIYSILLEFWAHLQINITRANKNCQNLNPQNLILSYSLFFSFASPANFRPFTDDARVHSKSKLVARFQSRVPARNANPADN